MANHGSFALVVNRKKYCLIYNFFHKVGFDRSREKDRAGQGFLKIGTFQAFPIPEVLKFK